MSQRTSALVPILEPRGIRSPARRLVRAKFIIVAATFAATALLVAGCGTFRGEGQIGPDLHPHVGASVSLPLGK